MWVYSECKFFHKTGVIQTKMFDQCKGEFVYGVKAGSLMLCNVSSKEIIKGDSNA
jgi:hypothetical protein